MKYLKMLGLAAVAAMALMAFVGASAASATTLEVGGTAQNKSVSITLPSLPGPRRSSTTPPAPRPTHAPARSQR